MIRNGLKRLFNPTTIAVIGASNKKEHTGYAIMKNLIYDGFQGRIYPVNPNAESVFGSKSYKSIDDVPEQVDLAVIALPAAMVPDVLESCGKKNIHSAIIISSGFKESGTNGETLFDKIGQIAKTHDITVLGPNCLGFIRPTKSLNITFANKTARPGGIAFISQSGALGTAVLDWSVKQHVGFSYFVSVGEMLNVGFHDLIDYFGSDPETSSILLYMESLDNARKFLSATRAYARTKPIIALKAGKSQEGARAAHSHTGSLAGNDEIFNAAFARAGMLRVNTIGELFDCAEVLATQRRPTGNKLAIVTNAGGPGVIATDFLMENSGELAQLSKDTMSALDAKLPSAWSHGNPVDVLGDADALRYKQTIETVLHDPSVDAVLTLLTPQAMTHPTSVAKEIIDIAAGNQKTILTSFLGEDDVLEGKNLLMKAHIPTYETPEKAIQSFINLYTYAKNVELLYETPATTPHAFTPKTELNREIIKHAVSEERYVLTELEAKQMLANYDMPIPLSFLSTSRDDAAEKAASLGFSVAMKIISPNILHKIDVGGVILNIRSKDEAKTAYDTIINSAKTHTPSAEITGVLVEPMYAKKYELFIGCKKDRIFGPAIVFGMGGIAVELYNDVTVGLPPLNMALAMRMITKTKIYKLLSGFRGAPGVDISEIQFLLYKFSYLVMDFPEIKEIDINPFGIDEKGGMVLDAKIILDEAIVHSPIRPYSHLVISPYPSKYIKQVTLKSGGDITLRPIRPEDEPMEAEMFTHFSEETQRFRFFTRIKDITHQLLIRYTQIDYDREIAIIAEENHLGKKQMLGVTRLIADPYGQDAEFAIVIADPWQHEGLGSLLMDYILEIAKDRRIQKIYAYVLPDNEKMLAMMKKRNFTIRKSEDNMIAELKLF
ncbi:MAG TPA: GNAT family N-acetyltransferase [Patescibacteria group bacterium]|nr:GNAT family N-acetyltransferase [Patescibacteria group bacterium]